jgi:stringent starvation protein B
MNFLLPISWRRRAFGQPAESRYARQSAESLFDEEEGEGMVGFNIEASRRDTIARQEDAAITERRLSRELEEGFRDDSDDETRRDERETIDR